MDGSTSWEESQILRMPGVSRDAAGPPVEPSGDFGRPDACTTLDADDLAPQFWMARSLVAFGSGTATGAVALMALGYLPPIALVACIPLVAGMVLGLVGCHQSDPILGQSARLAREAEELAAHLKACAQERGKHSQTCRELEAGVRRDRSKLIGRRNALENEGRRRQAQIRAGYNEVKQQLLEQLQTMCEATDRERKVLDQERLTAERNFQTDLASLADQGEREAAGIIETLLRQHVLEHLTETRVTREELPDLAEELLARLVFMGITRAIDISFDRLAGVPGLGTLETLALCGWRTQHEEQARRDGPRELPPDETHEILMRYHQFKKHLEAERHASLARINDAEQAVRERRKDQTRELETRLATARQNARKAWREINEEYAARFHGDAAGWLDGSAERRELFRQASQRETELALELAEGRERLGELTVQIQSLARWTLASYARGVFFLPVGPAELTVPFAAVAERVVPIDTRMPTLVLAFPQDQTEWHRRAA